MTRGSFRIAAALVTSLLAGLVVQPTPAHASATPLRILLEGDSITQGFDGDFTWRYRFYKELVRQGVSVNLVGTSHAPFVKAGYSSSQYADPRFDSDHFARVSSTLGVHAQEVGDQIRSQDPDVVVLEAGVNDLRNGVSAAATADKLRTWITNARAAKPDVRIIISSVLDATDVGRPWLPARIRDFRQRQAYVVNEMQSAQSPITLADTDRGWSVAAYTYDNLHPTPTGETLIAQRIAEEFHRLGYLPQAPHIFRSTVWTRSAHVTARTSGRKVVLTWDQQALSGVHVWMRRVGGKARILRGLRTGGSFTTPRLKKGARYQFRIQMVRDRIATPYGPLTTVRVGRTSAPPAVSQVRVSPTGISWTKSPGATKYGVTYRRGSSTKWIVKRVRRLSLAVTGVSVASVRAINRHGKSAARTARA